MRREGLGTKLDVDGNRFTGVIGISSKLQKVCHEPGSRDCVSIGFVLNSIAKEVRVPKQKLTTGSTAASVSGPSIGKSTGKLHRQAAGCNTGHLSRSSTLPQPSTIETPSTSSFEVRQLDDHLTYSSRGSRVVDKQLGKVQ